MSEIEERQQAPIMVLISSSCGLDYAYPQSAGGLAACRSVSELMPPVIAVGGTRLVPGAPTDHGHAMGVAACGRRTANHACRAEVT